MIHTRRLRPRLSYANVMSTMAVFVALGGSSYAAVTINGWSIRNRSIPGAKLRHDTLTGRQIKESKLARVPHARNADKLGGLTAVDLKIKCPTDTFPSADVCVERTPRVADVPHREHRQGRALEAALRLCSHPWRAALPLPRAAAP